MLKIWKFDLEVKDEQAISMPASARVLTVQTQDDRPRLWALVDPYAKLEPRRFRTYGTGHPVKSYADAYVGTYQQDGGRLVFHVFEVA